MLATAKKLKFRVEYDGVEHLRMILDPSAASRLAQMVPQTLMRQAEQQGVNIRGIAQNENLTQGMLLDFTCASGNRVQAWLE